jgi:uncharacterized protein (TIGR02145 family)
MMKKWLITILLFMPVLFACTDKEELSSSSESNGQTTTVHLGLSVAKMAGEAVPQTKATKASDVDENKIDNLWILQYQSGSLVKKTYMGSVNPASFEVQLTQGLSNVYFVANWKEVGNLSGPALATEAGFKSMSQTMNNEGDVFRNLSSSGKKLITMYGELQSLNVPFSGYLDNQTVNLTRLLARIDLTYSLNLNNFKLRTVRLCNMGNELPVYSHSAPFPIALSSLSSDYSTVTGNTSGTLTFYVPENTRGTGSNASGDPRNKTGIAGATYIELVGNSTGSDAGDEVTYRIYPGADNVNDYNVCRNTYYQVAANVNGMSARDARLKLTPRANCYIVKPGGTIYIPVKRANESDLGMQIYDTRTGWTPDILWQTAASLVTVSASADDRSYGLFKVTVAAGTTSGNAVVYVKDGAGAIKWSWHIWVTDYDPDVTNQSYNSLTWMDRNLGATTNTPATTGTLGLYYQWGRKDPEIGPSSYLANTTTPQATYTGTGGVYTWPNGVTNDPGAGTNLSVSVANPSTHYYTGSTTSDWYTNTIANQNRNLWGSTKTVYDPCPVGWKVPSKDAWSTLNTGNFTWSNTDVGSTYTGSPSFFYPATGVRVSSNGSFYNVGTYGYYWSSAVSGASGYNMYFVSGSVNPASDYDRANGFSVRCVKE